MIEILFYFIKTRFYKKYKYNGKNMNEILKGLDQIIFNLEKNIFEYATIYMLIMY